MQSLSTFFIISHFPNFASSSHPHLILLKIYQETSAKMFFLFSAGFKISCSKVSHFKWSCNFLLKMITFEIVHQLFKRHTNLCLNNHILTDFATFCKQLLHFRGDVTNLCSLGFVLKLMAFQVVLG